ncbi:NUDIX domain-containing protein [Polaromonas sp. SM01]|uniref:NUDIX domain-containing protein n=1 Tax=Polaromonas sp. SM01 TaxID=3085630 RepID=UPI0029828F98|nr:NUDIX domain-containing protein [Polaromonas sp. SM01]MDW5442248.1 NUDIX domain-containing protein [Polaromonas sp. SM01]
MDDVDPHWLAALRASASQAPQRRRLPLLAGDAVIGSVEPDFLSQIVLLPLSDGRKQLSKVERPEGAVWQLQGEVTASLQALAEALREAGLAHAWRDEQLAVMDAQGHRVGSVERAVVRVLGIATQAVHLVAQAEDGRFWVQQRAWSKANDPGLWDTLMGGMVSGADTLASALERETWEEAGLQLGDLKNLRHGGQLDVCCPCTDGHGAGYVIEHIAWYRCTMPDRLMPQNQDGEVERFVLMDRQELLQKMQGHAFTREAALIQTAFLA